MPETALPQQTVGQRNWAPWLGFLLALVVMFSSVAFFIGVPGQRAIPWLGAALAIAALACAAVGIMRAFRQPQIYRGKVSSSILGAVTLIICALFALGSFQARNLPSAAGAPQVGQKVPDFTLADTNGAKVSLSQLLGKADIPVNANNTTGQATPVSMSTAAPTKALLLIFYRGYW
jgi:hypothetical protein